MEKFEILGGILKRIGNFDNRSLGTRIIFQKTVYFLQVFGINLDYNFDYYIYGPYSKKLALDGYVLEKKFNEIKPIEFNEKATENRFVTFQKFIQEHTVDSKWLEAAASMHFLKKINTTISKKELINTIKNKQKYLNSEELCEDVYKELKNANIMGD